MQIFASLMIKNNYLLSHPHHPETDMGSMFTALFLQHRCHFHNNGVCRKVLEAFAAADLRRTRTRLSLQQGEAW